MKLLLFCGSACLAVRCRLHLKCEGEPPGIRTKSLSLRKAASAGRGGAKEPGRAKAASEPVHCRPISSNGPHPALDSPIRQILHFRMQPLHLPPGTPSTLHGAILSKRELAISCLDWEHDVDASDRARQEPRVASTAVSSRSPLPEGGKDVRSSPCSEETEESR